MYAAAKIIKPFDHQSEFSDIDSIILSYLLTVDCEKIIRFGYSSQLERKEYGAFIKRLLVPLAEIELKQRKLANIKSLLTVLKNVGIRHNEINLCAKLKGATGFLLSGEYTRLCEKYKSQFNLIIRNYLIKNIPQQLTVAIRDCLPHMTMVAPADVAHFVSLAMSKNKFTFVKAIYACRSNIQAFNQELICVYDDSQAMSLLRLCAQERFKS